MKILLDGEQLEVEPAQELEMLEEFQVMGVEIYEKQGLELQLLAMPFARWILARIEKAASKTLGRERAKQVCRPPKKADPVIYLSHLMIGQLQEILKYAEVRIETDGERHATGFSLSFKAQDKAG